MQKIIEVRRCSAKPRRDKFLTPVALVAVLVTGLAGCTVNPRSVIAVIPATGYKSYKPGDIFSPQAGYTDSKISENRYLVTVQTSHVTPRDRVQQIAFARAAELTIKRNNKYFRIVKKRVRLKCKGLRSTAGTTRMYNGSPKLELEIELAGNTPRNGLVNAYETFENVQKYLNQLPTTDEKVEAANFYLSHCDKRT